MINCSHCYNCKSVIVLLGAINEFELNLRINLKQLKAFVPVVKWLCRFYPFEERVRDVSVTRRVSSDDLLLLDPTYEILLPYKVSCYDTWTQLVNRGCWKPFGAVANIKYPHFNKINLGKTRLSWLHFIPLFYRIWEHINWHIFLENIYKFHGRRLRGDCGDGTPKFEVGDGPCIRPPNISRSRVIGCVAKYELTKKVSWRNVLFWNRGFSSRIWSLDVI